MNHPEERIVLIDINKYIIIAKTVAYNWCSYKYLCLTMKLNNTKKQYKIFI